MLQQSVTYQLADGMRLVFIPTDKFKTVSLALFLHLELRADLATRAALLSAVLERGSRRYPDSLTLRRELEQLYGAELSTDIHKKGERHLISCTLEMVHSRFVGEGEELFRRGVSILGGIIGDPLLEKGSFREEYVAQEKEHLAQEIKGLINDKAQYALERCLSKMCQGERYGVYKLGRLEDLEQITPRLPGAILPGAGAPLPHRLIYGGGPGPGEGPPAGGGGAPDSARRFERFSASHGGAGGGGKGALLRRVDARPAVEAGPGLPDRHLL